MVNAKIHRETAQIARVRILLSEKYVPAPWKTPAALVYIATVYSERDNVYSADLLKGYLNSHTCKKKFAVKCSGSQPDHEKTRKYSPDGMGRGESLSRCIL